MSDRDSKPPQTNSADWTHLLSDPDLVRNLGKLLQTYRDAPSDQREQALLEAMLQIKAGAKGKSATQSPTALRTSEPVSAMASAAAAPAKSAPPFEPDIFTPTFGQDRRKFPRLKCCVAVELRITGSATPVWGNLSNASLGGCFVETVTPVSSGSNLEIGLWVSSDKIWVKGIVLNGVVTQSTPSFGIRIKFGELESAERTSLREFLKYVESSTKQYEAENSYLARLKR
ncbi:MAG TPA: PilZ domain-containing protein [Terriglobales bacterium]|nr:PilZ domain-containing protein [Terriglobales bacterium]